MHQKFQKFVGHDSGFNFTDWVLEKLLLKWDREEW